MLVHIIADYGYGDLAFAEVVQRIKFFLPDADPLLTPVPAFSTLAAGFCVAQLGLNEAPSGTIIYHNIAPRLDAEEAREDNAGERLAYARLHTGVRIINRSERGRVFFICARFGQTRRALKRDGWNCFYAAELRGKLSADRRSALNLTLLPRNYSMTNSLPVQPR